MDFQALIFEKQNGIGTITLNRPDRLNALNEQLINELATAVQAVAKDEEIRVLVVTGAGRAFCAGGDFAFADVRAGSVLPEDAEDMSYDDYLLRGHLFDGRQGVMLGLRRL